MPAPFSKKAVCSKTEKSGKKNNIEITQKRLFRKKYRFFLFENKLNCVKIKESCTKIQKEGALFRWILSFDCAVLTKCTKKNCAKLPKRKKQTKRHIHLFTNVVIYAKINLSKAENRDKITKSKRRK